MSADIVPFSKKLPAKKKFKAAEEGIELEPPSEGDLQGFINTITFLALQSVTNSMSVDLMGDELTLSIRHHDEFNEDNGVMSASSVEFMAGCYFDPADKKQVIKNLLTIFERLDIDSHEAGDEVK